MLRHLHRSTKMAVRVSDYAFALLLGIGTEFPYTQKIPYNFTIKRPFPPDIKIRYHQPWKLWNKAATLAEKNEDLKALLDTYHKFALLYLEIDDRETTLFYWDRAGVLLKDIEYPVR